MDENALVTVHAGKLETFEPHIGEASCPACWGEKSKGSFFEQFI